MKKIIFSLFVLAIAISCNSNNTNNNETVSVNLTPDQTVEKFVELLGTQNFQDAYNLTANPNWGSFSEFSSTNAFGGINETSIYEIKITESSTEKATVYVDAAYYDDINGNSHYKQNYFLQKYGDDWKIIDMEVTEDALANFMDNSNNSTGTGTSTPTKGVYTNGSIYLIIYQYSTGDESFEGILLNKSNGLCLSGLDVSNENSKWLSEEVYDYRDDNSQDCTVEFVFSGNSVTLKSSSNCYGLNSTLTKSTSYSTPNYGTYSYETSSVSSELQVSEIDDYGISFNLHVATQSACTGDIPEDGSGTETAYGTNGAYIFDNWDGCTLLITFSGSTATISEIKCDLHGANCSFNGNYTKE